MTTITKPKIKNSKKLDIVVSDIKPQLNQVAPIHQHQQELERILQIVTDKVTVDNGLDGVNIAISLDMNGLHSGHVIDSNGNNFPLGTIPWHKADNPSETVALMFDYAHRALILNPKNYGFYKVKAENFTDKNGNAINPLISRNNRFRNTKWVENVGCAELIITKLDKVDNKEVPDDFGFYGHTLTLSTKGLTWLNDVVKPDRTKLFEYVARQETQSQGKPKPTIEIECQGCGDIFASVTSHKTCNGEEITTYKAIITITKA